MTTGLIFDIKRFAIHDGPGIRTTVFLKGCPLRCWWCQNPESIRELSETIIVKSLSSSYGKLCNEESVFGKEYSVDDLIRLLLKDRIFYEESNGGITFSGGEPMIQNKFLKEVLIRCKFEGISTAIDTSGYVPFESINEIYDYTDIFLYDLKLIDNEKHKRYTDVSNEIILENLNKLTSIGDKVHIRIPLIPGITDTEENLAGIIKFLDSLTNIRQIHLLPYNKIAESKYKRFNKQSLLSGLQTQSEKRLVEIKSFFDRLETQVLIRG